MKVSGYLLFFVGLILSSISLQSCTKQKELVWSDEFDYNGLPDSTKWGYDVGGHGWGNNELQYYTKARLENANVNDGVLRLTAQKELYNSMNYTSARLVTKKKGDWQYGRIEVRAIIPDGKGTWPAIWMLPTQNKKLDWPLDGEIDIMEHVGYNQGTIYGTIHTKKYNHAIGTQKSDSLYLNNLSTNFHTYGIEWNQEKITWFVDENEYLSLSKNNEDEEGWPFDKPFHLILNIAVGGDWGGKYGVSEDIWPKEMKIDFVRVYQ